jgi:flagella basal body P-ring formation protein FlgA
MLNPKLSNGLIKIDNSYYSIKIDASILAYVADKTIKINEFIEPNVNLKEIKFRVFYSPLVYNVKNLVAKQIISKNGVITKNNTKKAPDVFKNQSVQVIIKSPNIDIITSAVALNDGNVGEFIKIKLNNKILNAQIIKPGVVTIK